MQRKGFRGILSNFLHLPFQGLNLRKMKQKKEGCRMQNVEFKMMFEERIQEFNTCDFS
jgi:hypothetical protein